LNIAILHIQSAPCVQNGFINSISAVTVMAVEDSVQYEDLPMDFADACLVVITEEEKDSLLVTLDKKDFSVFRRHGRDVIPILSPNF
jgi:predicted nucleic acid-binding protein